MKTITMTLFRRPGYTKIVLDSLFKNNLEGYELFVGIDQSEKASELVELVKNFKQLSGIPVKYRINAPKFGIHQNNYFLLDEAFSAGSSFNVHIEDDTPLSPDAMNLAEWYRDNNPNSLLLNLFYRSKDDLNPLKLFKHRWFDPWGWACRKEQWERWIQPNWMCDQRGWDWSINQIISKNDLYAVSPCLSRSCNIGKEDGIFTTPEVYEEVFKGLIFSQKDYGKDFSLD
jgi:hypothetical protein